MHLASGLLLLALHGNAGAGPRGRPALRAWLYGAVFVWGLITGDSVAGIIAVNDADQVLHAALAGTALLSALVSPAASYADKDATATRLTIYEPGRPPERPAAAHRARAAGGHAEPAAAPRRRLDARAHQAALVQQLGELDGVRRGALAQVVGDDPQVERALVRRGRGGCGRRARRRGPRRRSASG